MTITLARAVAQDAVSQLAEEVGTLLWGCRPEAAAAAVAAQLAPMLRRPDLLAPEQRVPQAETYARNLLHADPAGRFSVWAMVWAPGQGTVIHDHRCWCVMGVHDGTLTEESYRPAPSGGDRLEPAGRLLCRPGAIRALHPGAANIHRVVNSGSETAVSIHIYGFDPALACSSVDRVYAA